MRILFLEDNGDIKSNVAQFLEKYGHEVVPVSQVGQAIEEFDELEGRFDVLISEIFLLLGNGRGLLKKVKLRDPSVTVLVLTDNPNSLDSCQALQLGAHAFIPKPLKLFELVGLLKQIQHHRQERGILKAG